MTLSDVAVYLPNYLKTFGWRNGMGLFLAVMRIAARGGQEPLPLRVPGLAQPLWLRPAAGDIAIFHQVFVKEDYQTAGFAQHRALLHAYQAELDAGRRPLIIDAGAHIGLASRWLKRAFPQAVCYAMEPDERNYKMLVRNAAGTDIVALRGGVWDASGALSIVNPAGGATAFRLAEAAGDQPGIRAYTIPEIMAEAGCDSALIVKIDIEGGEAALFRSNTGWVDSVHLLAVELHDWLYPGGNTSQALLRETSRRSFDYLFRGENMFCFRNTP